MVHSGKENNAKFSQQPLSSHAESHRVMMRLPLEIDDPRTSSQLHLQPATVNFSPQE